MGQRIKGTEEYAGRHILRVLLIAAVLVNIKSIFFDFDIDAEYATAMSYRMLKGDRMFLEMWEPHQTSAFLTTFLMKIYVALMGTTTGVILYLHTVGALLHGAVTWLLWLFLKKRTDRLWAGLMCVFFLVARPKDIVYPEFSNMQLWFSVLLFLCILLYLENCRRKRWLLLAALCLCLEVIAYPSCVIVAFGVALILWFYSEDKWKDILLFLGACAVVGSAYMGFFVVRIGWSGLGRALGNIVSADGSHQGEKRMGVVNYFGQFGKSLLWIAICFVIAWLWNRLIGAKRKTDEDSGPEDVGSDGRFPFLFGMILLCSDVVRAMVWSQRIAYGGIYVVMIAAALFGLRHCGDRERRIVCAGMVISGCSFVGTILLTNLNMLYNTMYLVLAVMVSFLPLGAGLPRKTMLFRKVIRCHVLILFCIGILFRRGVMVKTPSGFSSPLELGGVVKGGPAIGIVTDYMGAFVINSTLAEWGNYVYEGDNVLIVGSGGVSTLGYLYADTGVSVQSTICTPTYNEKLLEYWEEYPDKYPDCVIVSCWYGELKVEEESWIMTWLDNEYQPADYAEGMFWRYYRAEGFR